MNCHNLSIFFIQQNYKFVVKYLFFMVFSFWFTRSHDPSRYLFVRHSVRSAYRMVLVVPVLKACLPQAGQAQARMTIAQVSVFLSPLFLVPVIKSLWHNH
jgi:hypothetical protein